jgi:hypothetical protein
MKDNKKIIFYTTIISVITTLTILYLVSFFKGDEVAEEITEKYGTDFPPVDDDNEYGTDFFYSDENDSIEQPTPTLEESYKMEMANRIELMLDQVGNYRAFFNLIDVHSPTVYSDLEQITTNMKNIYDDVSATPSEWVPQEYKTIHTGILNSMYYIRSAAGSVDYLANGAEGIEHYIGLEVHQRNSQKIYDNAAKLEAIYEENFK